MWYSIVQPVVEARVEQKPRLRHPIPLALLHFLTTIVDTYCHDTHTNTRTSTRTYLRLYTRAARPPVVYMDAIAAPGGSECAVRPCRSRVPRHKKKNLRRRSTHTHYHNIIISHRHRRNRPRVTRPVIILSSQPPSSETTPLLSRASYPWSYAADIGRTRSRAATPQKVPCSDIADTVRRPLSPRVLQNKSPHARRSAPVTYPLASTVIIIFYHYCNKNYYNYYCFYFYFFCVSRPPHC